MVQRCTVPTRLQRRQPLHLQLSAPQQGEPVCQRLTADPIDARVVEAFFEAVAPAELEAWARAQAAQRQAEEAIDRTEAQQIERLRYQALWPSASSTRSIRTTAMSPANWNAGGRWLCASCTRPTSETLDAVGPRPVLRPGARAIGDCRPSHRPVMNQQCVSLHRDGDAVARRR